MRRIPKPVLKRALLAAASLAIIVATFVGLLAVFSRHYLEPYETALGQVVLAVVALYWAAGFWWMHRMGRVTPTERFLASTGAPR